MIKVILVGDKDSGKTSLLKRLVYDEFSLMKEDTIGIEIATLKMNGL